MAVLIERKIQAITFAIASTLNLKHSEYQQVLVDQRKAGRPQDADTQDQEYTEKQMRGNRLMRDIMRKRQEQHDKQYNQRALGFDIEDLKLQPDVYVQDIDSETGSESTSDTDSNQSGNVDEEVDAQERQRIWDQQISAQKKTSWNFFIQFLLGFQCLMSQYQVWWLLQSKGVEITKSDANDCCLHVVFGFMRVIGFFLLIWFWCSSHLALMCFTGPLYNSSSDGSSGAMYAIIQGLIVGILCQIQLYVAVGLKSIDSSFLHLQYWVQVALIFGSFMVCHYMSENGLGEELRHAFRGWGNPFSCLFPSQE